MAGNVVRPVAQGLAALEDNRGPVNAGLVPLNVPLARGEAYAAAGDVAVVDLYGGCCLSPVSVVSVRHT